jgi:hypothetical protein
VSAEPLVRAPAALSLELAQPVPPEVPVGASVVLQVRVLGAARDLRGGRIEVINDEQVVATAELIEFRDDFNETAAFGVKAPDHVGAFTWTVRFPPQNIDGVAYGESALLVSSQTRPHRTSLAVWAVPMPVRMADRFAITVGAKSSGAYALGGAKVEIRDESGAKIGDGALGDTPWPGTDALYWTEIELAAPPRDGMLCWNATFAASELELPHLGASAEFSFTAVKPPEHSVTIKIIARDTAIPLEEAQVALGPFRAGTDKAGLAYIEVPPGTYDLAVWKAGFEATSKAFEIAADLSVQFELTRLPEELTAWD